MATISFVSISVKLAFMSFSSSPAAVSPINNPETAPPDYTDLYSTEKMWNTIRRNE